SSAASAPVYRCVPARWPERKTADNASICETSLLSRRSPGNRAAAQTGSRSDQDGRSVAPPCPASRRVRRDPPPGSAAETADPRLRERCMQTLFHLLRSCAEKINVLAAARGAVLGDRLPISTVVALHAVRRFVKRHGDRAVLALQRLAAGAAQHY